MWIESFNLVIDTNNNGVVSLAETWQAIGWLYRLPGNLVIELLGAIPPVANLLHIRASTETGYQSLNGGFSVVLSLLIWLLIVVEFAGLREQWKARHPRKTAHRSGRHFRHPAGKA